MGTLAPIYSGPLVMSKICPNGCCPQICCGTLLGSSKFGSSSSSSERTRKQASPSFPRSGRVEPPRPNPPLPGEQLLRRRRLSRQQPALRSLPGSQLCGQESPPATQAVCVTRVREVHEWLGRVGCARSGPGRRHEEETAMGPVGSCAAFFSSA